jgi:hypothetical protein
MVATTITPIHPAIVQVSQTLQVVAVHPAVQVRLVAVPL